MSTAVPMYGFGGGGGASLNFKVVGGTSQPSSPKENTIWINTSTTITDWVFSAKQPTAASGRVWISTGISSATAFNALKKNGIQVYPISAKQYVSGVLVDKTAKIYQYGKWVDFFVWDGELYDAGNEFTSDTGGLEFSVGRSSTYSEGIGTKGNDSIILECSVRNTAIQAVTANKIDLTEYSTLKCNVKSFAHWGRFVIASEKTHDGDGVAYKDFTGTGVQSLDVSSLNRSYHVCVYTQYAYNGSASYVEFDKLWLE